MVALLVTMHETVKDYIDSGENQPLATEIGSELLQLSRAVIKKHTFDARESLLISFSRTSKDIIEEFHVLAQNYPEKIEVKNTSSKTMGCVFLLELAFGGI